MNANKKALNRAIKVMLKSNDPVKIRVAKAARRRQCGDCQVCCEIMSVPDTTGPDERCPNQCEAGCSIYKTRPTECAAFLCCWRMGVGPESARPDRSRALVDPDSESTRADHALAAVRFTGPFEEEPIADLLADLEQAWGGKHFALISAETDADKNCSYFSVDSGDLYKHLALAAATGASPWNEENRRE